MHVYYLFNGEESSSREKEVGGEGSSLGGPGQKVA